MCQPLLLSVPELLERNPVGVWCTLPEAQMVAGFFVRCSGEQSAMQCGRTSAGDLGAGRCVAERLGWAGGHQFFGCTTAGIPWALRKIEARGFFAWHNASHPRCSTKNAFNGKKSLARRQSSFLPHVEWPVLPGFGQMRWGPKQGGCRPSGDTATGQRRWPAPCPGCGPP